MNRLFLILLLVCGLSAQTYDVGEIISQNHQNTEFDVCYGEYESDVFHLADLNGATNGGNYHIIFIDMAATW
jgi:hypothetical protein